MPCVIERKTPVLVVTNYFLTALYVHHPREVHPKRSLLGHLALLCVDLLIAIQISIWCACKRLFVWCPSLHPQALPGVECGSYLKEDSTTKYYSSIVQPIRYFFLWVVDVVLWFGRCFHLNALSCSDKRKRNKKIICFSQGCNINLS